MTCRGGFVKHLSCTLKLFEYAVEIFTVYGGGVFPAAFFLWRSVLNPASRSNNEGL